MSRALLLFFVYGGVAVSPANMADVALGQLETCQERVASLERQLRDERQENTAALGDIRRQIGELSAPDSAERRRMQGGGSPTDAAANSQIVHIFKRTVVGPTHLSKYVAESNGGHRLLGEKGGASCTNDEISRQIAAINAECCDEPSEDCSGDMFHTCNAGCSALITLFWAACQDEVVGVVHAVLGDAAALCPPVSGNAGATALQLMSNCNPGSPITDDCIPVCELETHGFLLQLNVSGVCAKLTCELSVISGLYYWIRSLIQRYPAPLFRRVFQAFLRTFFLKKKCNG